MIFVLLVAVWAGFCVARAVLNRFISVALTPLWMKNHFLRVNGFAKSVELKR